MKKLSDILMIFIKNIFDAVFQRSLNQCCIVFCLNAVPWQSVSFVIATHFSIPYLNIGLSMII